MKKFILAAFACTAVAGACVLGACGDMSGGADEVAGRKYRLTDYELTYEGDFIESLLDGIDIDSILRPALEQGAHRRSRCGAARCGTDRGRARNGV